MQRENMRVVVASEHPKVLGFLKGVVAQEGGAVTIGQAKNTVEALALARNLKPDVAVIDCRLPHVAGSGSMALSRIGGLDTAQSISQEVPDTRVILLGNLDEYVLPERGLASGDAFFFSRERTGANIPLTLRELYQEALPSGDLVFADIGVEPRLAPQHKATNLRYKSVLFTALGTLGGLLLILTVTFGGGILLALAGVATMFLNLAKKLMVSLWSGARQPEPQAKGKLKQVSFKVSNG